MTGFPGGSDSEESACNARGLGSVPGSIRSPGEGNGNPLQYSCLKNSMDRGAWQAPVLEGHKESDMTEHFSLTHSLMHILISFSDFYHVLFSLPMFEVFFCLFVLFFTLQYCIGFAIH